MSDVLVSIVEAAKLLGVDAAEIYRLIDAGELPAFQRDHKVMLRAADVATHQPATSG